MIDMRCAKALLHSLYPAVEFSEGRQMNGRTCAQLNP